MRQYRERERVSERGRLRGTQYDGRYNSRPVGALQRHESPAVRTRLRGPDRPAVARGSRRRDRTDSSTADCSRRWPPLFASSAGDVRSPSSRPSSHPIPQFFCYIPLPACDALLRSPPSFRYTLISTMTSLARRSIISVALLSIITTAVAILDVYHDAEVGCKADCQERNLVSGYRASCYSAGFSCLRKPAYILLRYSTRCLSIVRSFCHHDCARYKASNFPLDGATD